MADKVIKTVLIPNFKSKKLELTLINEMVVKVDGFINEELVQTYRLEPAPMFEQEAIEKYKHFTRYS